MHYSRNVILAIAPFLLGVHAQVDVDMDDVPNPCKDICRPIGELSDKCDVDLRSDNDADEHHLQNQCICTNQSFDVAKIAAMCADCMHQTQQNNNGNNDNDDDDDDGNDGDNHADSDDLKDIDGLLSTCGFSSTTYNSASASAMLASVTVSVDRPTDVSQLTTTIDGQNPGSGAGGVGGNGGSSQTSAPSSTMMNSGSTMATPTPTGGNSGNGGVGGSGNDNDSDNNNDNDSDNDDSNQSGNGGSGGASPTTETGGGVMPTGNLFVAGGLAAAAYLMG